MVADTHHSKISIKMPLPTRSDLVPSKIGPQSTNRDVRRYVVDLLQRIDADITSEKAWEMVEVLKGDGYDTLELDEKDWKELFGEIHGKLIYKRVVRFQNEFEYVGVSFHHFKVHVHTDIYLEGYNMASPPTHLSDFHPSSRHSYRGDYFRERSIQNRQKLEHRRSCLLHLLRFRLHLRLRKIHR